MKAATPEACQLFMQGLQTLSEIESNGWRVNVPYLENTIAETKTKIDKEERRLRESKIYRKWRRRWGDKANFESPQQVAWLVYDELGFDCRKYTDPEEGQDLTRERTRSTDAEALAHVDHPFVNRLKRVSKLYTIQNSFLGGIRRATIDGFLHPTYNLHVAVSYRSSASDPNSQNWPIRDLVMAEIIRNCFIARDDHVLVEIDYSQIEVRAAACYNHDPVLISYIEDKTRDMHRDMACEIYRLKENQVTKPIRHSAKNKFVFPEFYGSYYRQCAPHLWQAIEQDHLEVGGKSLYDHLARKGIKTLGACDSDSSPKKGTFEYHVQQVEDEFWNDRFSIYTEWKKKWYKRYLKTGGFSTLTGFRFDGVLFRNDVINYPVQGSAFHCLLLAAILLQRYIKKHKMRALIVGQIHDSIIADVHRKEVEDYIAIAIHIMTKSVRKIWDWIIVPLEAEAEVAPIGGSWFDKKKWEGKL